jgi:hypothetical protein
MGTKKKTSSKKSTKKNSFDGKGRLSMEKIDVEKMNFSPDVMACMVKRVAQQFGAKNIPMVIVAMHPSGKVSGQVCGTPHSLPMLAIQAELTCKEAASAIVERDPTLVKELAEGIEDADKFVGERKRLRDKIAAKLKPDGEINSQDDLDPSDPVKFFEGLAKLAQDPNAQIKVMGFSPSKASPAEANKGHEIFGDLLRMLGDIKRASPTEKAN